MRFRWLVVLLFIGMPQIVQAAVGSGGGVRATRGSLQIREFDLEPSSRTRILRFPNGMVTINGATATINAANAGILDDLWELNATGDRVPTDVTIGFDLEWELNEFTDLVPRQKLWRHNVEYDIE